MLGDGEIPERDEGGHEGESSTVRTDLTVTESTISGLSGSSDLASGHAINSRVKSKKISKKGRRDDHRHENNYDKHAGGGDRHHPGGSVNNQRNWAEKYDKLLAEVNEIRVNQAAQVSTLESELKLKSFELKRADEQIKSLQSQLKTNIKEKSEACSTVNNLRDELDSIRRSSDLEVCNLTMTLHEKSIKLEMYEKIQAKIDHVLFPDLPVPDSAVGDADVEGILSNFGYGNISIDAKMKLQQSLDLAKRLASERDHLEKSRGETQLKLHEVEKRYHDLLIQFNQLKLSDKYQTSELQSELKLKKFELGRLNILYTEMDGKFKDMLLEKERLAEKFEAIREEFSNSKSMSEKKITGLTLQLQEKSTRLETYDRLEAELDKVIVQAAALPNQQDADEILSAYGYGSSIPSNMKRRLEQSLRLARRVLELENFSSEQKTELFAARDRNIILKRELESMQTSIKLSGHPTSELLQVIQKRDLSIMKLDEKIRELELCIKRITSSKMQLEGKIAQLEAKLKSSEESITRKQIPSCLHKRFTAVISGQSTNNNNNNNNNSSQCMRSAIRSTASPSSTSSGKRVTFRTFQRASDSSIILPVTYKKVSASTSDSYLHLKKPLSFTKMSFQEA